MSTMHPLETWNIAGRDVHLPVQIRHARQWAASWLVAARSAQTLIDYSGLQVLEPLPGKALFTMAFVDYLDGDLDTYREVAFSVLVLPHDADLVATARDHRKAFRRGNLGAFIHDLPVDESFTCEAGNTIWGYPKWLADISITSLRDSSACSLSCDEGHQFSLEVGERGPFRFPSQMPPTYSWRDGILRRTEWEISTQDGSSRLGGGRLALGARGPIVQTLRQLGLPRRPLMTSMTPHLTSTFGPAEVVHQNETRPKT